MPPHPPQKDEPSVFDKIGATVTEATTVKKKKKVVKKKKPPIPVPSLTIAYENPPPRKQPRQSVGPEPKGKKQKHGGHLPTQYEYMTPSEWAAFVLGREQDDEEKAQIKARNQWRERDRRDDARATRDAQKAERDARRAEVRKLGKKEREFIGTKRLQEYIRTGEKPGQGPGILDYAGAVGKAALDKGAELTTDFTSRLRGGLSGRESGREYTAGDDPFLNAMGEGVLGENIVKAMKGEDFDREWLMAELALAFVPIKGLPTPMTALLRSVVGTQRLIAGRKAGLTVAELVRPISEVKAGRRLRLLEQAADETVKGPIPSSKMAGILAGDRQGRIARAIRNDVRATRKFTVGDATIETAADLSRSGKAMRALMDRIRSSRVVPLRSENTMFFRQVGRKAMQYDKLAEGHMKAVDNALPKGWRKNMDWPGIYAVRTVAKGIPIEDSIRTTQKHLDDAIANGDWLGEQANRVHLGMFQAAQKYVATDPVTGHVTFSADAPESLGDLRAALQDVSAAREDILSKLDVLSDERAKSRILNEQLHYAQAQMLPQDDWVAQRLGENVNRQKILDLWTQTGGEAAARQGILLQDANARRIHENAVAYYDEEIARVTDAMNRNPGALADRHRVDIARMEAEKAALDPGAFYDDINDISGVLPDDVVQALSKDYGEFEKDWKFSLFEDESDIVAGARRTANEIIAQGLPLPPELDTPAKLAAGIEEVFKLAKAGEAGKDWYPTAAEGVQRVSDHTGVPPKQVAQLFAIFSQAADTVSNATFVFDAIRQFQMHGDLFSGRFPVRQSEEALAVLKGGTWEGRKRSSFYANMLRHIPGMEKEYEEVISAMAASRGAPIQHPVTVDRWVVRMFRPDSKKDVPEKYYDTFETIMQSMAAKVGWEPEQIQAAAWVAKKDEALQGETRQTVRHLAGAEDAFQFGINRQLEQEAQGGLFDTAALTVRPQAKRLANQANKKWGGFTVDKDLNPVPEVGYVVTMSLTERAFPLHKLKGADVEQFAEQYKALLKDKRNVLGGFSDDANDAGDGTLVTYLSISRQFKRKGDAMKYAREQGQETVYEYKTGDGIRTGLSRDEQAAIIDGLRPDYLKGGPVQTRTVLTSEEQQYEDFLDRAAHEFLYAKEGKKATPSQKSRAEEWLNRNAHQYEDEDLIQEWYALARSKEEDIPPWMVPTQDEIAQGLRFSMGGSQMHPSLFDEAGNAMPNADGILTGKGEALARDLRGYEEAVTQLERQEIPKEFITAVANSSLHIYDKTAIGRHLDSLAGGTLRGKDFADIPGAARMFPDVLVLAGLWEGETRKLYFGAEAHPVDWIHEFVHVMETADAFPPKVKDAIWSHVGAAPGAKLTHDQSEDAADMVTSMVLGFDAAKSQLPADVKSALTFVRDAMVTTKGTGRRSFTREHEMLAALPEEERIFLEDIFMFNEEMGPHFTNGFKPQPGAYIPEQLGLPFKFGNPLAPRRAATHWARLLGGKRITTLTPTDEHLTHAWKGDLVRSGRWEKSVVNGPIEGLLKAHQIQKMTDVRDKMIEIGRKQPTGQDDVMVPVDPGKWADETKAKVRGMVDILNAMDRGDTIDDLALDRVDAQAIEGIKDFLFPGLTDAVDITNIVKRAMVEEIPGVVWVSRSDLKQTGLFTGALAPGSAALKYGLSAVDTANNIMKMMTLSLNPAYYPMNMGGQAVMLGSQLTWSAPFSLARSLSQWRRMSDEDLAIADAFAGIGFAGSQFMSKGGLGKRTTDTVGKVGTILIDKYPRRASFFHEARRLGYKSDAQMSRLLNDPALYDDLFTVHERVNRAMVDYGNLNRFEREAMVRLAFVYPWLRGSTRYAAQFPFDHPFQASLFAGLIYWQQNRLQEAFPEGHPGYVKWFLPLDMGQDETGQTPYGFRMDQLMTPLQTLDLAAMAFYWGTGGRAELPWGSNEEGMASMLGPLAEEIEKTISGWDSFAREEVSHGLPQFFMRILDPRERWASWNRLEKIMNRETHKGIYDTSQLQNWLRLFLGSLAPINMDPEKAAEQAAKTRGTPSAAQVREDWAANVEEVTGEPVPDEWIEWRKNEQAFDKVSRRYRDEHDIEGVDSTIQERLAMIIWTVAETRPDLQDWARDTEKVALAMSDAAAQENYDSLREQLGLRQIGYVNGVVRKRKREQMEAAR